MITKDETNTTKKNDGVSKSGLATCYVVEIGGFYDTPDTTRIFSTYEKALNILPYGFEERPDDYSMFLAINEAKEQWFTIKRYIIE